MAVVPHPEAAPSVGSLVRTRGRDWVVLSSDHPDVLRLRPLTGSDEDAVGLFWPLEHNLVASSHFSPPDPATAGDSIGGVLLQDAARLSVRNRAAPFRSLGRLTVVPRLTSLSRSSWLYASISCGFSSPMTSRRGQDYRGGNDRPRVARPWRSEAPGCDLSGSFLRTGAAGSSLLDRNIRPTARRVDSHR